MKRIIALGAVVALIVVGWSGAWLYAAGRIKAEAETLGTPGNVYGVTLTCAELGVGGFPFRFDVTCGDARMSEGDLAFSLAELQVTARVYRLNHILIFAKGPFAWSDAFFGTEQQVDWSLFEASVRVENNKLARASVHAENLAWSDMLVGQSELGTAEQIEAHLLPLNGDGASATVGLALFINGKSLQAPAFGINNGRATLEAELDKFPADIAQWSDPALLANWQANGGKVNLIRLEADEANASLSADGTLWLSATGYPEADLKVQSAGLAEKFALDPQSQTMFFGADTEDGTRNQTIIVREGSILVGLVPSGRLAPWF